MESGPLSQSHLDLPSRRGIFCNRTLNLRSIKAIGYDMDYTLIHYKVKEWERRAYEYLRQYFVGKGWPVAHFQFDSEMTCRGLIVDKDLGNLVKSNRFGFVKHAFHGTQELDFEAQRKAYSRTIIDLHEPRWVFVNTLFSISEGCFFSQAVELLDRHALPGVMSYSDLYKRVRAGLDFLHMEGKLKADILADPERFIDVDPDMPLALLDQKNAGKKLLLITNSEWSYTVPVMDYAINQFLPEGMTWRDLFEVMILSSRKPDFFSRENPLFEVVNEEGLLKPSPGILKPGTVYFGGSARQVETSLGLSGDEILYVGDHMFGDVWASKSVLRWRTALVLRELEDEIGNAIEFRDHEIQLSKWMAEKEQIESEQCQLRLKLQRKRVKYGPQPDESDEELQVHVNQLRARVELLDEKIGPLARAATALANPTWGTLMRAGNDKSHLAFQIERYADIYTSRVSNFLAATPFVYLRSRRGVLPHEPR
ncbi:HAD-IG family 5'-nucleotidase [Bdellovibrionota bacterium FG-1]